MSDKPFFWGRGSHEFEVRISPMSQYSIRLNTQDSNSQTPGNTVHSATLEMFYESVRTGDVLSRVQYQPSRAEPFVYINPASAAPVMISDMSDPRIEPLRPIWKPLHDYLETKPFGDSQLQQYAAEALKKLLQPTASTKSATKLPAGRSDLG